MLAACGGDDDETNESAVPDTAANEETISAGSGDDTSPPLTAVDLVEAFPDLTFDLPVAVEPIPGSPGSYVVVERAGKLFWVDEEGQELIGDIGPIELSVEGGVWNIVFSPNFQTNNQVYIYYGVDTLPTRREDIAGRLSRFDFDNLSTGSATPLLTVTEHTGLVASRFAANIHHGGGLAFGPDGYLYLGVGDGGPQGDPRGMGQNIRTLPGTILRLDVEDVDGDGDMIPEDNPFTEVAGCADGCDEIFAYGFRNPWRLSFDGSNPEMLWVADVGHLAFEEINVVEIGGNYGWAIMEGPGCFQALVDCRQTGILPVAGYEHEVDRRLAITGGFVYRGDDIPGLAGYYLHGDFNTGTLRATFAEEPYTTSIILEAGFSIVSFGQDSEGEPLVVDLFGGKIYRLVAAATE